AKGSALQDRGDVVSNLLRRRVHEPPITHSEPIALRHERLTEHLRIRRVRERLNRHPRTDLTTRQAAHDLAEAGTVRERLVVTLNPQPLLDSIPRRHKVSRA